VQDGRDRRDAVDKAWAGAHDETVGIDGPHRHTGELRRDGTGLVGGAVEVEAAGRDEHDVHAGVGELLPRRLHRAGAGAGRDRFSTGGPDQVRYPVSGGERRIHPFHDADPGPGPVRDGRGDGRQPGAQAGHEALRPIGYAGAGTDGEDGVEHLVQGVRVQRQHVGPAAEIVQCVGDLAGRQGAHPAQVLGQDQFRGERGEGVRVQGVQVGAGRHLGLDVAVDVRRGHAPGVPAADHDGLVDPRGGRLVALERHPDQIAVQAEGVDDFRGGGQQ
jgi:hypothetical protein